MTPAHLWTYSQTLLQKCQRGMPHTWLLIHVQYQRKVAYRHDSVTCKTLLSTGHSPHVKPHINNNRKAKRIWCVAVMSFLHFNITLQHLCVNSILYTPNTLPPSPGLNFHPFRSTTREIRCENRKSTEWPQTDLEHLTVKGIFYTLNSYLRGPPRFTLWFIKGSNFST